MGITLSFVAIEALNGDGTFKEKIPVRTIMHLSPVVNVFVDHGRQRHQNP